MPDHADHAQRDDQQKQQHAAADSKDTFPREHKVNVVATNKDVQQQISQEGGEYQLKQKTENIVSHFYRNHAAELRLLDANGEQQGKLGLALSELDIEDAACADQRENQRYQRGIKEET